EQNYPNPFNPTTVISFSIPEKEYVSIKVFDILGNELETLVNGYKVSGNYKVSFDGNNYPSGTYFYQIKGNNYTSTKKMLLLK
ncbi:MAG: T9SS type A sorting domain-containing protein, partial [Ignavibacteriae bacterium]|nr:T9SS type A sorting domain-containing protein [Ignavibacteriota bacterium]